MFRDNISHTRIKSLHHYMTQFYHVSNKGSNYNNKLLQTQVLFVFIVNDFAEHILRTYYDPHLFSSA